MRERTFGDFAGQVLQKSERAFAQQKIVSWCAALADFDVPHQVQSAVIRRGGEKDGATHDFVANLNWNADGNRNANVNRFSNENMWNAENRYRVVVPKRTVFLPSF